MHSVFEKAGQLITGNDALIGGILRTTLYMAFISSAIA